MSWMRESFVLSLTCSNFGLCHINYPLRATGGHGSLWAGAVRGKPGQALSGCAVLWKVRALWMRGGPNA